MKLSKVFSMAALLLTGIGVSASIAMVSANESSPGNDFTSSIADADFASLDGWSRETSGGFFDLGNGLIGEYQVRTDFPAATVDEWHPATTFCAGLECRWSASYASLTQQVELPSGFYALSYDVENTNASTMSSTQYENLFWVDVNGTTYVDQNSEWMKGQSGWTTHTIKFEVPNSAAVSISLGYGTGTNNISVAMTPALYVSNLKLLAISEDEMPGEDEPEEPVAERVIDDGSYYLYNVGGRGYLVGGNNWGTRASISATGGIEVDVTMADGKYLLSTSSTYPGKGLGLNGYVDSSQDLWTLVPVDGLYNTFMLVTDDGNVLSWDGGTATTTSVGAMPDAPVSAYWQFCTPERRLEKMAEATADNPVDATFLISNPNFGRVATTAAWTIEANNQNLSGGNNENMCAESYHSLFTISQTIDGLPAGKYKMTAQGFYRQDNGLVENAPVFFANDKTAAVPVKTGEENSMTDASISFTAGLYTIEPIEFTVFEGGSLTIGVKGTSTNQWVIWDNFQLTYYGNQIDLSEVEEDYMKTLQNAQSLLSDSTYLVVTGIERNELASAVSTYSSVDLSDQTAMTDASIALGNAASAFTAATSGYAAFAVAKAGIDLSLYPYAQQGYLNDLNSLLMSEPGSADEALQLTNDLTTVFRLYAYSHSLLEGVSDVENMTDVIYNPMADVYTDGWETILGENSGGAINVLSNERPNYGYEEIYSYFDGGNWADTSWDVTLQQNISLPAGKYMLSVMSRASNELYSFRLFAGDNSKEMTHIGAQNGVYGWGWNDASLIFELTEDTELPIGVQGVTTYIHNWMSFTNFRLMRFPDEMEITEPIDMTAYIVNAGFDSDLTIQADGTMKTAVTTDISLSDRSWAYIAADNTVYARPKETSSQSRPDGRKLDAVNGFWGQVKGWTLETNGTFPNSEWTYFGSVDYDIAPTAVPLSDDGSSYLQAPERPTEFNGGNGFLYLRAGWTNSALYKQVVKLPCAKYRLEYWTINLNPSAYATAEDLTKIICRNDVFKDVDGTSLLSQQWTKHEFEFTPTAEFTLQFGFKAANSGSGSQPIVALDGIKLYKIGEADQNDLYKQDLQDIIAKLEVQATEAANWGLFGIESSLWDALDLATSTAENNDLTSDELEQVLNSCRTTLEQAIMAIAQVNSITALTEKMQHIAESTRYPGYSSFIAAVNYMKEQLGYGSAENVNTLFDYGKAALNDYYHSQIPSVDAPADYTYLITHPWFINEDAEPYIDETGNYFYPNGSQYVEGGSNDVNPDITMQGWIWWRHGSAGYDMRPNWAQGRSCFNAWFNTPYDYRASIVQDLTNVPEGYYTLSADMLTQEGCVTNQHVFASLTSYNIDAYAPSFESPSLTTGGWSDEGESQWTTLTTPVFYVGADGLLTIGARGNHLFDEEGISSSAGWFLVTNFRLNYYGTTAPGEYEEPNALYIAEETTLPKASVGTLPVSMKNADDIKGLQFDIVLPYGMTIANGNVNSDRSYSHSHNISYRTQTDGTVRVLVTSWENESFSGNDGVVLNLDVNIPAYMEMGDYAVTLKNVVMTNSAMSTIKCSDKTFVVSLSGKMGDVNNDGDVNVTDVVMMIDYILQRSAPNFNEALADINADNRIDVTDVVTVINVILERTALARTAKEEVVDRTAYTAFQMDLTIPAGYVLEGVELTEMAKRSHTLAYNVLADGCCRVVVCSMDNAALPGAWNEVINLKLRGQGEPAIAVDDAVFVTIAGERHELTFGTTTGIASLSTLNSQLSSGYDLQGRRVEKATKGLIIVDGKKTVKK